MTRTTLLRRQVLLAGLTMSVLLPIGQTSAQQPTAAPQNDKAPFGLTWGMSADDVTYLENGGAYDSGYNNCNAKDIRDDGISCGNVKLPDAPDDTNEIDLFLGFRDKLFGVYAAGMTGETDSVMTRYRELSSLLSDLYGPGRETVAAGRWFGREPADTTLRDTLFSTDIVQITLSMKEGELESGRDAAYWTLTYWHLAGLAEYKADELNHKKNAL
ncbi:hypothetical protein ACELLULO517_16140 [Acidisoma cellulosilytica]|uniref:Uncharacterized protein n=1 Tax=Acidisoma cellulosilyticum TaxID=2802395 RepID=A0A963Z4B4_9PROT|nr:hypothetical protein [Acidisoma cellulosilyticum]MCB8881780.1 hypothetical protein [Acidisoma cellulosilyticum]